MGSLKFRVVFLINKVSCQFSVIELISLNYFGKLVPKTFNPLNYYSIEFYTMALITKVIDP